MSFNPLFTILKDSKLTGSNYTDWKRKLDIVLTAEGYKFCTLEVCPPKPEETDKDDVKVGYAKWIKADEMSKCYILASMSDVLQHQHQSFTSAYDMLYNLKELFGSQNRAGRQVAMKALMNTTMAEGTPVRDHVLKMMGHLNEMEILGAEIDGETQVDIILMSLPDSYQTFRLNYNMNKRMYNLAELMTELQAAEGLIRQHVHVNVAEKGSSSKPSADKGKKKVQPQDKPNGNGIGPQGGMKKPKGRCFRCKQSGHWKGNCPLLKGNSSGISHSLVTETFLAVLSTSTWCVDTGATNHVCNSLQGFQETRKLNDGEMYVFMGKATRVAVVAVGDVFYILLIIRL